jgi:integrase
VSKSVEWLLADNGLDVNKESESFKRLCREMLKVEVKLLEIAKRRDLGDYDYEETLHQVPIFSPELDNRPTETITEVIKHYVSESEANWTPKTKAEIVNDSLALLMEAVGDVPLQSIDRRKMNEFKQILRKLPPNRNKLKQYRDKSIGQLVRMNVKKTLSERTINKHLTRIGTLFDYAITNGFYNGPNPALKMSLKLNQSEEESRAAYDLDELEKLFHSEKYLTDSHLQPYQFWTPILALFTGMRQNEIAQLYLDDIREKEGVWYFDLNRDSPDKRLKNMNARRKVPIHKFLLDDLRLLDYVNHLMSKGEVRAIPRDQTGSRRLWWASVEVVQREV